jgi:hypothetical protein
MHTAPMLAPPLISHLRPTRWVGAFLAFTSLSVHAEPVADFFRMLGWSAVMGLGQLVAWALGLAFIFLMTFLVPGAILRALVRAPLLWALCLLMVPRWRVGPWGWSSVLLGLATAALAAWLIERRWNDDDVDLDLT